MLYNQQDGVKSSLQAFSDDHLLELCLSNYLRCYFCACCSSPALKWRCDTGVQSAAASRRTAANDREVINRAPSDSSPPSPTPTAAPSIIKDSGRKKSKTHLLAQL
ncbi:hypothetical protein D4764_10G0003690 [Takifugu flavidus]|uniref:Uncharacterized protein n=1 Tax=Takifugu flavidus TaxID=433684 RepID=A0A5C6PKB0_9TELE|nr:hypothetical protein D4764_10G0003690 [Takifugu flavidus]